MSEALALAVIQIATEFIKQAGTVAIPYAMRLIGIALSGNAEPEQIARIRAGADEFQKELDKKVKDLSK